MNCTHFVKPSLLSLLAAGMVLLGCDSGDSGTPDGGGDADADTDTDTDTDADTDAPAFYVNVQVDDCQNTKLVVC